MRRGPKEKVLDLAEVERLAGLGLTNDEIAYAIGCSPATLYARKSENLEMMESIQRGKAKALAQVANTLFEAATTGKDVRAAIEYLRRRGDGWKDRPVQLTHGGSIDATAHINIDNISEETILRMAKTFVDTHGGG